MILHKVIDTFPTMVHIVVNYVNGVIEEIISISAINTENDNEVDITEFAIGWLKGDNFIDNIQWDEIYSETKNAYYES